MIVRAFLAVYAVLYVHIYSRVCFYLLLITLALVGNVRDTVSDKG